MKKPHGLPDQISNTHGGNIGAVGDRVLDAKEGALENPWGMTPKANQAKTMSACGIRVPHIFENIEEGVDWLVSQGAGSGARIYLRSEHPDDGKINARSGLLSSLSISYLRERDWNDHEKWSDPKFYISGQGFFEDKQSLLTFLSENFLEEQKRKAMEYGYDPGLSFSAWEGIKGDNYTLVEDKNVPGVYFIHPISVSDRGAISKRLPYEHATYTEKKLIDMYRNIVGTGKFGKAPIIEMQLQFTPVSQGEDTKWHEGDPYFLQALQTYDGEISNWTLDRKPEQDEFEAYFVRGVTPQEGAEYTIEIIPPGRFYLPENNGIAYNGFAIDVYGFSEDIALQNLIEHLVSSEDPNRICLLAFDMESINRWSSDEGGGAMFLETLIMHAGISMLHKPKISFVIPWSMLYTYGAIRHSLLQNKSEILGSGSVKVRIISDGRRAFIKILTEK